LLGFPSTSYDWYHQAAFFKSAGYGVIAPDIFGYVGTSKPTSVNDYRYSLILKDIIDILDTEKIEQAIVVGHDWLV
jgi:soluble epoxide hydrolase / lipid-phosphate phosphatase